MHPITIIGTGLAGYTVAREFRKLDKDSPLRLITSDDGNFYSKPMLSNAFTKNKTPENLVAIPVAKMIEQLNTEILTITQVTQLTPLKIQDKQLEYSKLVLALGAYPIQLPFTGSAADDVMSVNDLNDYTKFRKALTNAKKVVIMGAGLIGCEFANDLQQGGFEVTIVDPAPHPLGQLVPKAIGQTMQKALQNIGISFHFGKIVTNVDKGYKLTLNDDSILTADVVLSAVGLIPRTKLVTNHLSINRGILVDRYLQTSMENIYSLGDCAEVEGLVLPFIMPLMNAAKALAKTLAGEPTQVNYPAMPVVVKTSVCPLVVSPPKAGLEGKWQVTGEGQNLKALFFTPEQKLAGFALTGTTVAEKMTLAKDLPALLK